MSWLKITACHKCNHIHSKVQGNPKSFPAGRPTHALRDAYTTGYLILMTCDHCNHDYANIKLTPNGSLRVHNHEIIK